MAEKGAALPHLLQQRWSFCFLLLLLRPPSTTAHNQLCDPDDLRALQDFSSQLNSGVKGWSFNATPSDCCAWLGVSCGGGSGGRVVGLELQNKSLEGALPDSITDLDDLVWLDLSGNFLKGSLPAKLFLLPRLELLNLSMNEFNGSIPNNLFLPSIRFFNISCNYFNGSLPLFAGSKNLVAVDVSFNAFSGGIHEQICDSSPGIRILRYSMNHFSGEIPAGIARCAHLEELSLDLNNISGNLPEDLFGLSSLRALNLQENQLAGRLSSSLGNLSNLEQFDLSLNSFSGHIPEVFRTLNKLECFCVHSNNFSGTLPASMSKLSSLKVLNLRNNSLTGDITLDCKGMTHLMYLDLGTNFFTGPIPDGMHHCRELRTLNLARNNLTGHVPESFKNFAWLSYLSLSNNSLSNISSAMAILQDLPRLTGLVLTMSFHRGEQMPVVGIQGFRNIQVLVIANCGLSGSVPPWLANCSKLQVLDLSWNKLQGSIPTWMGYLDGLFYLDLSNNSLGGKIPASLASAKGLISFDASKLAAASTDYFPFFIKRNNSARGLQYNQLSSFPPSLILCNNRLVGPILPGFGNLKKLHTLDLSRNELLGTIPEQLSGMASIESLDLSHNHLTGSIPLSLTQLNFLSSFSVAYNNLTGFIPTGGQFSTFSGSDFEGNPGLCGYHLNSCDPDLSRSPKQAVSRRRANRVLITGMVTGIGLVTALILGGVYFVVLRARYRRREDSVKPVADAGKGGSEMEEGSRLVLLFRNKDSKELNVGDILKSTNNFDQANIIGCGGFGLVYKATLPGGSKVAIKRLSGDYGQMEREFQAEVETLSRAQHRNLVLLQGYCKIGSDRLLIYSYMENGSLDYWLHEKLDGGTTLDWRKRLRIAQGAVRGLAYLHQSCDPHILHRDIKSSNILLDDEFEAHLADFGLARLILPYDTHVTTDLVGTLGYIPPEYGQSSVATFKGDIYSFGVVLLELLTGKRPLDMCKPKAGRELVSWVLQMRKERREVEVFDACIYDKAHEQQLKQLLEIACRCLSDSPKLRPSTSDLVSWLESIGLDDDLQGMI